MIARFINTNSGNTLLPAVRSLLVEAEEARLSVAFVRAAGVHLLKPQLDGLGDRCRLVTTTVFGSTSVDALDHLSSMDVQIRVKNLSGGTYHPKVYAARKGDQISAVLGSSNLTGGLAGNVEAGMLVSGRLDDPELGKIWEWSGQIWDASIDFVPGPDEPEIETFDPGLLHQLRLAVAEDPVFLTLGSSPKPNRVTEITETGIWIETERSRGKGAGSQEVPCWMLGLAYDTLKSRGRLANSELLNELRVHRSSAVMAILARLPDVEIESRSPISLRSTARG